MRGLHGYRGLCSALDANASCTLSTRRTVSPHTTKSYNTPLHAYCTTSVDITRDHVLYQRKRHSVTMYAQKHDTLPTTHYHSLPLTITACAVIQRPPWMCVHVHGTPHCGTHPHGPPRCDPWAGCSRPPAWREGVCLAVSDCNGWLVCMHAQAPHTRGWCHFDRWCQGSGPHRLAPQRLTGATDMHQTHPPVNSHALHAAEDIGQRMLGGYLLQCCLPACMWHPHISPC